MAPKRTLLLLFLGDPTTDRRVRNYQRLFTEAGWDVELLALTPKIARGPRKFFEYHRLLSHAVRSRHADVVMACDLYSLSATAWMRKHGRARVAIYDAREVYTELPSVATKPLRKQLWRTIEWRGMAASDLIVVTAPHDLQAILDVHGFVPRSLLIRNLPWRDDTLSRDRKLLSAFAIPNSATVFVYVGGLQPGRGLALFLQAMKSEAIHLLLIGDGSLREQLAAQAKEEGIADRVHFAGALESEKALRLAAACDAGVVLIEPISKSYELALPSKVFEYMMAGLPVLASQMLHVTELFASEEWITSVDVSDTDAIRNGIQQVLQLSQDESLRQRERTMALQDFHFERDATAILPLLERMLA